MPDRQPHPDNDLIDQAAENPTPSHSGSGGGNVARRVGARDEEAAIGADPEITRVRKSDKRHQGDMPNPPQRRQ